MVGSPNFGPFPSANPGNYMELWFVIKRHGALQASGLLRKGHGEGMLAIRFEHKLSQSIVAEHQATNKII